MTVLARPVTPAWMNPKAIKFITIHCTATPFERTFSADQISAMDVVRFGQVSYHHVFQLDGRDVQTLRYDQRGAHVALHNTGNIGLSYVGGLGADGKPADTRTDAQRKALAARLRTLRMAYPAARILGHRDWSPDLNGNGKVDSFEWIKACPCFDVAGWLKEIGL